METNRDIFNALVNLKENEVKSLIRLKLKEGMKVDDIMNQLQMLGLGKRKNLSLNL